MYKHLFGPVPSRRLGMSLGIDLIQDYIQGIVDLRKEYEGKIVTQSLERGVFYELKHK